MRAWRSRARAGRRCPRSAAGDHDEREGEERPAIWDPTTGERTDLKVDVDGIVEAPDWWPDASALLLVNLFQGRTACSGTSWRAVS